MGRLYVYVTAVMTVRQDTAFPTVITGLRDAGIEVIDYDEELRRVVARAPARLAPVLASYLRSYARGYSVEAKATLTGRLDAAKLKSVGGHVVRAGPRLLFLYPCSGWLVWGEVRGKRALLKLCRGSSYRDPASYPQGLCSHSGDVVALVEDARRCFSALVASLGLDE